MHWSALDWFRVMFACIRHQQCPWIGPRLWSWRPGWGPFLVESPWKKPDGLCRTAVNASDCNYWHDKPSESVSPSKASTCTCVWARRISSWQIRFAKSLMLSLAERLDKLDGVRRIRLADGTAYNVIGVTYAFGSSEASIYWKLGQSSINITAYKRRGVPGNPSFRILGRCRLLTSAT